MGYTHYWHRYKEFSKTEWASILDNARCYLESLPEADGFIYDYDHLARPAEFGPDQIHFTFKYIRPGNGEFEPLRLSRAINDVWDEWGCCKTWGRNPYDYAVTGVLALAEHFAPRRYRFARMACRSIGSRDWNSCERLPVSPSNCQR